MDSSHSGTGGRLLPRFALWVLGGLFVAPVLYLGLVSVASDWPYPNVVPAGLSLKAWRLAFGTGSGIASGLGVSLLISGFVGLASTAVGFVASRYIAYSPNRRRIVITAYVPFAMSPVIVAAMLTYFYIRLGLAGTITGVVLAQTMFASGFAIVFFLAFWNQRLRAIEGLVRTLGGTSWDAFRFGILPLSRGMLMTCFFQTFLISWFQYGLTLLVGSGRVQTLPLIVFGYLNEAGVALAAVASCLLVAPPLLLLWINRWFIFREGFRL